MGTRQGDSVASAKGVRTSQRRSLACQECTKRKVKCDKQLPCSRCNRLGLTCSREIIRLKRSLQHEDQIDFLRGIAADLAAIPSHDSLQPTIHKLRRRITQLQFGDADGSDGSGDAHDAETLDLAELPRNSAEKSRLIAKDADASLLTSLEHLAWGRVSGNCFPHRSCRCKHRSDSLSCPATGIDTELPSLPTPNVARKLVHFHSQYLAWHHNCLHSPTFQNQCEQYWQTGLCPHPLWIALYCSVLSATVFAIQNSDKFRSTLGMGETLPEVHELFSDMITALYHFHFLRDLSIFTLQAITISTEVAHNLGQSQLNATLINAAIRIAECLGLHRIQDVDTDDWEEKVQRETGKRVWCQMTIQDHFAIPFTESYTISPGHVLSNLPLNADDHDLIERPETVPTISSYVRVLYRMAALMPEMRDGLGSVKTQKTLQEQYMHILSIDKRMRDTVKTFPPFFLRQDLDQEALIPWLGIARHSLAITAAEKIIMIHRPFLFRSFQLPSYDFTRKTCKAAAMTILREHEALVQADDLSVWTHTAFCITAAVILCFEVYHSSDEKTAEGHKTAVNATRDRLIRRDNDLLAQRGVALIDALLEQRLATSPGGSGVVVDFDYIAATLYPDTNISNIHPQHTVGNPFGDEDLMFSGSTLGHDYMGPGFDSWFNDIFMHSTDPME